MMGFKDYCKGQEEQDSRDLMRIELLEEQDDLERREEEFYNEQFWRDQEKELGFDTPVRRYFEIQNGDYLDSDLRMMNYLRNLEEQNRRTREWNQWIQRANRLVLNVIRDQSRNAEQRVQAKELLNWIAFAKKTLQREGSLDLHTVKGLKRIVASLASGRFDVRVTICRHIPRR